MVSLRALLCAAALLAPPGVGAAVVASERPPLREVQEIDGALLAIAIADEVRRRCDAIAPRWLRAYARLSSLEARAAELGYSDAEIEDYIESEDEKARMRRLGEAYVRQQGYDPAVTAELCAFGRDEIASGSAVGRLLREK